MHPRDLQVTADVRARHPRASPAPSRGTPRRAVCAGARRPARPRARGAAVVGGETEQRPPRQCEHATGIPLPCRSQRRHGPAAGVTRQRRRDRLRVEVRAAGSRVVALLDGRVGLAAVLRPERRLVVVGVRVQRLVSLEPVTALSTSRLTSPSERAGLDRDRPPEADVDVGLAGARVSGHGCAPSEVAQRAAGGAQPQRAHPHRRQRHVVEEPPQELRRCGRRSPRRPAPHARGRAGRASGRPGRPRRTCSPARPGGGRRRCGATAPAMPGAARGSARRRPGSTRTSRCPTATGSRARSSASRPRVRSER